MAAGAVRSPLGYVASSSGGDDEAVAAIKAAGTGIQRTADRILSSFQLDEGLSSGARVAPAARRAHASIAVSGIEVVP